MFIKIGNQEWSKSNLNINHFNNGDPILEAKTDEEWDQAGKDKVPACCFYNNNSNLKNQLVLN